MKMPELKVPDFLLDLYYDLRERHLLPLVAILLVAIVAVPIALSGGSSGSEAAESAKPRWPLPAPPSPSSKLIVAKAAPGLRDYRGRLAGAPKDPFKQQYATPEGEGNAVGSSAATEGSSSGGAEGPQGTGESTTTETLDPTERRRAKATANRRRRAAEVLLLRDRRPRRPGLLRRRRDSKAEPSVRHNLPELTMLPSRKKPALTFIGVSKDEKKALMLVSDQVTALFGDGICVVGSETCQLLALEPGVPETVVYGAQEHIFRIELLKLRLLTTSKLHKAPLGAPKQKKSS